MNYQARSAFVILVFFAAQLLLVSLTFPVTELLTQVPLFHIDNAAHWYRITVAANLMEAGSSIGYDPYFNAGTETGIASNPAAKVPALIAHPLAPYLSTTQVWKLYTFAAACFAGIAAPLSMRLMNQRISTVISAGVIALLLWWVSMFRWFHTAGMVSFVLASYLGLLYIGLIYRYAEGHGGYFRFIGLGLLGAFGLYVHPLFPLPVALWTVIYLAMQWRRMERRRTTAVLLLVPAISLLPNLYWLFPIFIADPLTITISGMTHQTVVDWNLIWMELVGLWQGDAHGSKMYVLIAGGAVIGNLWTRTSEDRLLVRIFTACGIFWILYAALGAAIVELGKLTQPNRFAPVGYMMLLVPASIGTSQLLYRLKDIKLRGGRSPVAWIAISACVLILVNMNELRREVSWGDHGHYGAMPPEVQRIGPYTTFLLDWIGANTEPSARILFETSNGRIHDGYHVAGYLAYATNREFIGGPYVFGYFANFTDGFLFGERIETMTAERLREYVQLYNLGWVVAHSRESKDFFDGISWLTKMDSYSEVSTYRIEQRHSFFLTGKGVVSERRHNELVIDELEGEEVVLKYHYMRGLKTQPDVKIAATMVLDDPNPFIKLENPPPKVRIFYD